MTVHMLLSFLTDSADLVQIAPKSDQDLHYLLFHLHLIYIFLFV